jgi:hypothetical protein
MSATDTRVCLTMDVETFTGLRQAAAFAADTKGSRALLRAAEASETAGSGRVRLRCDEAALEFVRHEVPQIAARYPAVFGAVQVPRSHVLAQIGGYAPGQTVSGVEADRAGGLRLAFESGDALLVDECGHLEWRAASGGDHG